MNKEVEAGLTSSNEVAKEGFIPPKVTRDERGQIRWKLPGNTPEENEQLVIQNVQGVFLEHHPDFLESFSFGEDGKIVEDQRDDAREFILEHVGSNKKLRLILGHTLGSKRYIPYFHGNYRTALTKSFSPLGISFEWEEPVPQGWITNSAASKQIIRAEGAVKKIANQYRELHPEWFGQYLDSNGRTFEYYSPELVEQIEKESSMIQSAPQGWMTNNSLARQIKRDFFLVKKFADQFRNYHTDWLGEYLDSGGRPREHYSPELIDQIIREASKIQSAPQGWMTNNSLARHVSRKFEYVSRLAGQFRKSHPEWFGQYLDSKGQPREYYSPELVQNIYEVLDERSGQQETVSPDQANEELMRFLEVEDE